MTSPHQTLLNKLPQLEEKINYIFNNKDLLTQAFCHRSFTNENPRCPTGHNERLEFLGDAVLGLIAAEHVYRELPDVPEGELTHLRARLVEASSCVVYLKKLDVEDFILLGKGERRTEGRGRDSIWADLFEAIIGAIFLDGGFQVAEEWLHRRFADEMSHILEQPERNWKAELQDYSQKMTQEPPKYEVREEIGPDHDKQYEVAVLVSGVEIGAGQGKSKKSAQQEAAENAMRKLEKKVDDEDKE